MLDAKWAKCITMRDFATEISIFFRGIAPAPLRRLFLDPTPSAFSASRLPRLVRGLRLLSRPSMSRNGEIKSWQP